jgi:hypothetical protein
MLCGDMLALRSRPYANVDVLLGMTRACVAALVVDGPLCNDPVALRIAREVASIIDDCTRSTEFVWGVDRINANVVMAAQP